jgi:hypothetical protein
MFQYPDCTYTSIVTYCGIAFASIILFVWGSKRRYVQFELCVDPSLYVTVQYLHVLQRCQHTRTSGKGSWTHECETCGHWRRKCNCEASATACQTWQHGRRRSWCNWTPGVGLALSQGPASRYAIMSYNINSEVDISSTGGCHSRYIVPLMLCRGRSSCGKRNHCTTGTKVCPVYRN